MDQREARSLDPERMIATEGARRLALQRTNERRDQLALATVAEIYAMRQALEQAERSLGYAHDYLYKHAGGDGSREYDRGAILHGMLTSIGIARARIRRAQT